jgi:hypothetical protein
VGSTMVAGDDHGRLPRAGAGSPPVAAGNGGGSPSAAWGHVRDSWLRANARRHEVGGVEARDRVPTAMNEQWRREMLSSRELEILRKIVDDRDPALRPLVDDVLGSRLLTDDEIESLDNMLSRVMNDEPYLSQNWLAADHLIGRVASQAKNFWT